MSESVQAAVQADLSVAVSPFPIVLTTWGPCFRKAEVIGSTPIGGFSLAPLTTLVTGSFLLSAIDVTSFASRRGSVERELTVLSAHARACTDLYGVGANWLGRRLSVPVRRNLD